jgi:hypothetical protein
MALIAGGHAEEGIGQLREGLDHSAGAFEVMRTLFLAYLAEGSAWLDGWTKALRSSRKRWLWWKAPACASTKPN